MTAKEVKFGDDARKRLVAGVPRAATTGTPAAIASSTGMPNPSYVEGKAIIEALLRIFFISCEETLPFK